MQAFILSILYLLLYDRKQVLRVSLYELLFESGLPDCFMRFPLSYREQDLLVYAKLFDFDTSVGVGGSPQPLPSERESGLAFECLG